ncbi:hypothetical protein O3297_09235 [Janthinobacterium sp. SUN128]|uniref:hypothetical protein n=1 Tax=Janthinobacterium sp. SUN128 TaxID=3014790 RepID=UPI0027130475|nr:hypothetical protein [Janthinobacterium sp. SUN128]MDO8033598.1 hypothetical protein [Janthinobacterium sp. SUN128]
MGFAEKFVASLQSSNLRDDAFHHDLDAIAAAALAGDLGSLLCRVKYADGTINKLFEGNSGNLAQLLRIWTAAVTEKGKARRWVKINSERDIFTAHALYKRVAHASLAHWLDGHCKDCKGTGVSLMSLRGCVTCSGNGQAEVVCAGGFERERIKDMVSELKIIENSHSYRAKNLLRSVINL